MVGEAEILIKAVNQPRSMSQRQSKQLRFLAMLEVSVS